jgi:hypothetical protein
MSVRFIPTTKGWVNAADVARIERDQVDDGWQLLDRAGKQLGTVRPGFDPDVLATDYVPVSGLVATVITIYACGPKRPTEADIQCRQLPVLAWPVTGDPSMVVFAESISAAEWVIELPDGKWLAPLFGTYDSLLEAKRAVLEGAQEHWDEDHGPNAGAPTPTSPIVGHA